jgi:twinkle protein
MGCPCPAFFVMRDRFKDSPSVNWTEVRALLASMATAVVDKYIPGGKWANRSSYSCGDINGGSGNSFNFAQKDRGWAWIDFATGESGDIIDLIIHHEGDEVSGRKIALEMSGIGDDFGNKEYNKPKPDWQPNASPSIKHYLASRGLDNAELIDNLPIGKKDKSIVYLHNKEDKGCVFSVYKDTSKQSSPYCSKNAEPILWGMDIDLEDEGSDYFHTTPDEIVITEGHEDAIAWMHAKCRAVSIPMGASNVAWISNCWEYLQKFSRIYLSFDSDESGQRLTKIASERIGLAKCLIVKHGGYKDANDLWKAKGVPGMAKAMNEAIEMRPDNIVKGSELIDRIKQNWDKPRQEYGVPLLGDYSYFRLNLRKAETTIITGCPGSGKSNFLYQVAAHLVSIKKPVFIFSLEEAAEIVTSLVYAHCMASPCTVHNEAFFNHVVQLTENYLHVYDLRGQLTVDKMHEAVEYAVGRHGVEFTILDSLMMLKDANIEDNEEMNSFMGDMQELVTSTQTHLLMVAHSRKGMYDTQYQIPEMNEIKGSGSIGAMAFNVFTIWRNKQKAEKLDQFFKAQDYDSLQNAKAFMADNIFKLSKQKVGGEQCTRDLFYNPENCRFRTSYGEEDIPYIMPPE